MTQLLLPFIITGVLISVFVPLWNEILAVALCCLMVLAFAALQRRPNESASMISARADHVYLLGYVYTISALLGMAIRFWINAEPFKQHAGAFLFFAALKLSTTLAGLIGLLQLKALALDKERFTLAAPIVDVPSFANLSPLLQNLVRLVVESRKQDLQHLSESQETLVKHTKETAVAMSELNQSLSSFHSEMALLREKMVALTSTTDSTNAALATSNEYTTKLCELQDQVNSQMAAFSTNVRKAKGVLDDFVEVTKIRVDEL